MNARKLHLVTALAVLALGTACDGEKKAKSDAPAAESAKPKTKLEKALEAAAAASATPSAERQGPPQTGVFTKAASDAEQPAGAPAKLTMVKQGDGPKVALAASGLAAGTQLTLNVAANVFQGPLPGMVYVVEVAGDDAKAKAKEDGDAEASPVAGGRMLTLKVKKAEVDPKWPGKLQDGGEKVLAKLAGSKLVTTLDARGGFTDVKVEVGKDVKGAAYIVEAMAQALAFVFVPLPSEPVAEGASWLVSDRTRIAGLELVRYRAVTLQKVVGDDVVLGIDVRHYGPSPEVVPEGLPAGAEMMGVESFGQATVTRKIGDVTPLGAKLGYPIDVIIGKGGQPAGKFRADVKAELVGSGAAPAAKK
jgi:hypothetical protein